MKKKGKNVTNIQLSSVLITLQLGYLRNPCTTQLPRAAEMRER